MIYIHPIILGLVTMIFFKVQKIKGNRVGNSIDLGVTFFGIVLVYGLMPSVGIILSSLGLGEISSRTIEGGYNLSDFRYVQLMHLYFLSGFGVFYSIMRRPRDIVVSPNLHSESQRMVLPLAVLWGSLTLVLSTMKIIWGQNVGSDYISTYLVFRNAPILVQQINNVLGSLHSSTSTVLAISVVILNRSRKGQGTILAALIINILVSMLLGGNRTDASLLFLAYLVVTSILSPDFSQKKMFILSLGGLILFMIAGAIRSTNAGGLDNPLLLDLFLGGEFTGVFSTAVDIRSKLINMDLPLELKIPFYFTDLLRFVPSQIIGIDNKIDPSFWYASTFHPEYFNEGGGFAFGALAESIIGAGIPEALIRGALLGVIFASCVNRIMARELSLMRIFVYVWLVTMCYQSYRNTTLSMLILFYYQALPILIFTGLINRYQGQKKPNVK